MRRERHAGSAVSLLHCFSCMHHIDSNTFALLQTRIGLISDSISYHGILCGQLSIPFVIISIECEVS